MLVVAATLVKAVASEKKARAFLSKGRLVAVGNNSRHNGDCSPEDSPERFTTFSSPIEQLTIRNQRRNHHDGKRSATQQQRSEETEKRKAEDNRGGTDIEDQRKEEIGRW